MITERSATTDSPGIYNFCDFEAKLKGSPGPTIALHIVPVFIMEPLLCACGREFYQTGALATHRRSCQGSKRKVEFALQSISKEKWKKIKTGHHSSNTSVQTDSGPSHFSHAGTSDVIEVCDAKMKPFSNFTGSFIYCFIDSARSAAA